MSIAYKLPKGSYIHRSRFEWLALTGEYLVCASGYYTTKDAFYEERDIRYMRTADGRTLGDRAAVLVILELPPLADPWKCIAVYKHQLISVENLE